MNDDPQWRDDGVRVIPGDRLDSNTPQTPGISRAAAIDHARTHEPLECVLCRSGMEPVVVNLGIEPVENPKNVCWVDSIHPDPDG